MTADHRVLEAENLWKRYTEEGEWVLRGVGLTVKAGERIGVVGANGSGKTTLLRILAGLLHPSRGKVLVLGRPVRRAEAKAAMGVVMHNSFLYDELTVRENLAYYAVLYSVDYDPENDPVVESLGLHKYLDRKAGELSFGWRRRTDIARALLHRPKLLLIDEPFTGLDKHGMRDLARILLEMSRNGLAIVATSPRGDDLENLDPSTMFRLEEGKLHAF